MNLSIFVAQSVSLLYLSVGLGMLINPDYYKKLLNQLFEEVGALYIGGLIAFLIGFSLVTYHNLWVKNWAVIVTLIGWLSLIKGLAILIAPKYFLNLGKAILRMSTMGISAIIILLGLIFGYSGFLA